MPTRSDINAKAAALQAGFEKAGAQGIELPLLQPAETLLDLYGEDIRARAYVTSDALRGEQMLRPDFTVPVVQMHMSDGAEPARYTYSGPVFRRQEDDPDRPNEYVQVGYEVFDRRDPSAADAEVFALMAEAVRPLGMRAATGDVGLLMAAVKGMHTSQPRKAALMRHIWRPRKFRQLLDRYSDNAPMTAARAALLEHADPLAEIAAVSGKRSATEINQRLAALREDADTAPISTESVAALDAVLAVKDVMPVALERLNALIAQIPVIEPAVERIAARAEALRARGVDVDSLVFDAGYGRQSLEYYDGFVFGFYAQARPDMPAVASGGRYDALTRRLGQGAEIPAVGGVLRPGLMLELEDRP